MCIRDSHVLMHDFLASPRWQGQHDVDPSNEAAVLAFLAKHGAVGLVCFGSMFISEAHAEVLASWLDDCGPVIVQRGTVGIDEVPLLDAVDGKSNVLRIDLDAHKKYNGTPHSWLLPKVSWFVCHGGIGTTQAALRHRVPTMIVPVLADQEVTMRELAKRGLCPTMPTIADVTEEDLVGGRRALEASRDRWAALPAPKSPDYDKIQTWVLSHVHDAEPPPTEPYPDTWADLRERDSADAGCFSFFSS